MDKFLKKMQIVRRRLAEQGYTHVPYINNVEDKRNISYAMLVDRPEGGGVNSSAVIRYKDAEFNPLEKCLLNRSKTVCPRRGSNERPNGNELWASRDSRPSIR